MILINFIIIQIMVLCLGLFLNRNVLNHDFQFQRISILVILFLSTLWIFNIQTSPSFLHMFPSLQNELSPVLLQEISTSGQGLSSSLNLTSFIEYIVLGIGLLLACITAFRYLKTGSFLYSSETYYSNGVQYHYVPALTTHCTFLGKIYCKSLEPEQDILIHEQCHVKQYHWVDNVLMDCFRIIFWMNPGFYWLQSRIQDIHEFQADKYVEQHSKKEGYIRLLKKEAISQFKYAGIAFSKFSQLNSRIYIMNNRNIQWSKRILFTAVFLSAFTIISCQEQAETSTDAGVEIQSAQQQAKEAEQDVVQAKFVGGNEQFMEYMISTLQYPKSAEQKGIEGKTFIQFTVNESGEIVDPEVKRGFNKACDEEALRVVASMPNWEPAMKNGKPTAMTMTLPVSFQL